MMYKYPDSVLIVFARAPEPGKVKTRLIPALGKEGACDLYQHMASAIISGMCMSKLCPVVVYCQPDVEHHFFKGLARQLELALKVQAGGDLGEKMYRAISSELHHYKKAIVIGTDCPEYSSEYIEAALRALDQYDIVLGPAYDGGYVLIGTQSPVSRIFSGIHWGSATVLEATLRNIAAINLSHQLLHTLHDIDVPEDLGVFTA